MKKLLTYSLLSIILTGCATVTSEQKVIDTASGVTGVEISSIENRRQVGVDTFYTAISKDGTKYDCSFNGGDMMSLGIIQMSKCSKQ